MHNLPQNAATPTYPKNYLQALANDSAVFAPPPMLAKQFATAMDKKLVVIIDDEEDLCMLLKAYFKNKSYQVNCYHTLDEGLNAVFEMNPDVLFLDNNLPDGLGWDAGPQLAKNFPDMFINFISGFHPTIPAMPGDALYQVIDKPFSFKKLDALNL